MTRTLSLIAFSLALGCGAPATQSAAPAPEKAGAQPDAPKPAETAPAATSTSVGTSTSAAQSTETGAPAYHSMLVDDASALPECVKEAEGWLVYVTADSQFLTCAGGEWAAVEIKGEKGDDGAPGLAGAKGEKGVAGTDGVAGADGAAGANGADGAAGADGTDNRITSSIYCTGQLGSTAFYATYNAVLHASGDLFVTANIENGLDQTTAVAFYSREQNGAESGAVSLTKDEAGTSNYGWWRLSLNRTTLVTTVTYHDNEISGGEQSWTMTPDKCIVNDYE